MTGRQQVGVVLLCTGAVYLLHRLLHNLSLLLAWLGERMISFPPFAVLFIVVPTVFFSLPALFGSDPALLHGETAHQYIAENLEFFCVMCAMSIVLGFAQRLNIPTFLPLVIMIAATAHYFGPVSAHEDQASAAVELSQPASQQQTTMQPASVLPTIQQTQQIHVNTIHAYETNAVRTEQPVSLPTPFVRVVRHAEIPVAVNASEVQPTEQQFVSLPTPFVRVVKHSSKIAQGSN